MKFAPKTKDQIDQEGLLPSGEYDFEVLLAADKKSGNGNDMIELQVSIFLPSGAQLKFRDYLLEAMSHKLYNFCEVAGLTASYLAGSLQAVDCVGKTGKLEIGVEKAKGGFRAKNKIVDYVVPKAKTATATILDGPPETDDGVPF